MISNFLNKSHSRGWSYREMGICNKVLCNLSRLACTAFIYYESMKHVQQVTAFIYYESMKHVQHWVLHLYIMKVWNMYCRYCIYILWKYETCTAGTAFIYYKSMKHVLQVLHSYIMKVWNMYCRYCIHILWKYETCTTGTAFIYYKSMKHVLQVLHSFIIVWRNMFNLITAEDDHIRKFHPKGI